MQRIKIITALFLLLLVVSACKKQTTEPAFNPNGFWRGNADIIHIGILNRPDGTSRLYFRIFGLDTAGATIGTGTYTLADDTFKAEYLLNGGSVMYMESNSVAAKQITGQIFYSGAPDIVQFHLRKQ